CRQDAGGTFLNHETHEKPEIAELFVVQPLFTYAKKGIGKPENSRYQYEGSRYNKAPLFPQKHSPARSGHD
ncbi:MAG: hypothetical protein ACLFUS_15810, partial [Candidatus Sumerlaeia bacterium]